jgi:excisionase family DNA binding protein
MKLIVTTKEDLEVLVKDSVRQGISQYHSEQSQNENKPLHTTIREASKRLHVSELSVRNYIKRGLLTAKKVGNRILIDTMSIDNALSEVKSLKYKR